MEVLQNYFVVSESQILQHNIIITEDFFLVSDQTIGCLGNARGNAIELKV